MKTPATSSRQALAWDDLRLILALADAGSLAAAATTLGISHPTVSRRLRDTERRLGCRLIETSAQRTILTPAGQEALALARRMAGEIAELERRLLGRDDGEAGLVRLTAPDAVAEYLLSRVLNKIAKATPGITVELVVSNQPLSLAQREADIALRVTDRPDPALKGRQVAAIGMAVYAHRSLASRADPIAQEPWIGFEAGLACSAPGKWLERHVTPAQIRFSANTLLGAAKAVAQGIGIGVLPCFIGSTLPDVVRLTSPIVDLETGLWLLVHPEIADLPRMRRIREALAAEIGPLRDAIAGRGAAADAYQAMAETA
ncbi:MAG: LysR family transcriptional regulator [Proteobacteria bacterium]|nr:LysR family transcriptional regulator [Pseudomonadota bacterium]